MRVKTNLLFMAVFVVLTLAMVLPAGSVWANDSVKTVQGVITLIDSCSGTVFIDNVPYDARSSSFDTSGKDGAYVRATYSETAKGKVIKSIQVLQVKGGD